MFHLDTLSTLVAATLVLLLGRKLVQTVPFLKKYTIPEPVAGGLLVALALLRALGPVGAALLGLKVGSTIHWELPGGASTHLEVLELLYQPEAAGEFLR